MKNRGAILDMTCSKGGSRGHFSVNISNNKSRVPQSTKENVGSIQLQKLCENQNSVFLLASHR